MAHLTREANTRDRHADQERGNRHPGEDRDRRSDSAGFCRCREYECACEQRQHDRHQQRGPFTYGACSAGFVLDRRPVQERHHECAGNGVADDGPADTAGVVAAADELAGEVGELVAEHRQDQQSELDKWECAGPSAHHDEYEQRRDRQEHDELVEPLPGGKAIGNDPPRHDHLPPQHCQRQHAHDRVDDHDDRVGARHRRGPRDLEERIPGNGQRHQQGQQPDADVVLPRRPRGDEVGQRHATEENDTRGCVDPEVASPRLLAGSAVPRCQDLRGA